MSYTILINLYRHTFNNDLRDLGLQIQDRQALLAYASAETTKVYTNPNPELTRRYVNQILIMKNVTKLTTDDYIWLYSAPKQKTLTSLRRTSVYR
jgi:hypothetical protein